MYSKKVYHKMGYQNGRVRIATNRPLVCRFYKMRVIVTRSGALGPVSVIIRDDRLDKDAFQYNKVHGFNGGDLHLFFVEKRGQVPSGANTYWMENVLLPYISALRETYNIDVDKKFVGFVDGEFGRDIQSNFELFQKAGVEMGKLPASTSSQMQPADTSSMFKELKTVRKGFSKDKFSIRASALENNVTNALLMDPFTSSLPASTRKHLARDLADLSITFEDRVTANVIDRGWERSGFDYLENEDFKIDPTSMLSKCWEQPSMQEVTLYKSKIEELEAVFGEYGLIKESHFDSMGLFLRNTGVNGIQLLRKQDRMALRRQRAVSLLHTRVLRRFCDVDIPDDAFLEEEEEPKPLLHPTEPLLQPTEPQRKKRVMKTPIQQITSGVGGLVTPLFKRLRGQFWGKKKHKES